MEILITCEMKRLYFILVFTFLSLTSCCGQHTALNLEKRTVQKELLKEYFLCISIIEGFKDKQICKDDVSKSVYFDILQYSPEALQKVEVYAKEFVETIEPSPLIDLGNKKAVILRCIEQYKSKELDKFINSLDKFMLKD